MQACLGNPAIIAVLMSFAPVENFRHDISVVIKHGGGSCLSYPVVCDVLTFLRRPKIEMNVLLKLRPAGTMI